MFEDRCKSNATIQCHTVMDLLTGQQAQHHWFEADLLAEFDDLLETLDLYKDIATEYGLN